MFGGGYFLNSMLCFGWGWVVGTPGGPWICPCRPSY